MCDYKHLLIISPPPPGAHFILRHVTCFAAQRHLMACLPLTTHHIYASRCIWPGEQEQRVGTFVFGILVLYPQWAPI
jgi:hypothetical protein